MGKLFQEKFFPNCPLGWLQKAMNINKCGNATKLAMFIWYQSRITKTTKNIKIQRKKAEELFCVNVESFTYTLQMLETAGMVSVIRHPGQSPLVTIIRDKADSETEEEYNDILISATGEKREIKCKRVKSR